MKKLENRDEKLKGIVFINSILIIIALILSYDQLPFWMYTHSKYITEGEVINVIKEDKKHIIIYEYTNHTAKTIKRKRVVKTDAKIGMKLKISYNKSYPDYVYIHELESIPNFYQTLIGPIIMILTAIILTFGKYRIIRLN
jgi:hypothetical protein